tara:strand:- start:192 stop:632 length:441 start_codon:yes stop_codon:yes gene_type:complete
MKTQKRLAASILGCSPKKIVFDREQLEEIKEAITKHDMKLLIGRKTVKAKQTKGVSRVRANKILAQKRKGRQKGHGSRKGKSTARLPSKKSWEARIRKQRSFIKELKVKEKIDNKIYRELYRKCKGGFFRNQRHIKVYLQERGVFK